MRKCPLTALYGQVLKDLQVWALTPLQGSILLSAPHSAFLAANEGSAGELESKLERSSIETRSSSMQREQDSNHKGNENHWKEATKVGSELLQDLDWLTLSGTHQWMASSIGGHQYTPEANKVCQVGLYPSTCGQSRSLHHHPWSSPYHWSSENLQYQGGLESIHCNLSHFLHLRGGWESCFDMPISTQSVEFPICLLDTFPGLVAFVIFLSYFSYSLLLFRGPFLLDSHVWLGHISVMVLYFTFRSFDSFWVNFWKWCEATEQQHKQTKMWIFIAKIFSTFKSINLVVLFLSLFLSSVVFFCVNIMEVFSFFFQFFF